VANASQSQKMHEAITGAFWQLSATAFMDVHLNDSALLAAMSLFLACFCSN
jgi:hypothetical protein